MAREEGFFLILTSQKLKRWADQSLGFVLTHSQALSAPSPGMPRLPAGYAIGDVGDESVPPAGNP
jgi:hypothetical protein